MRSLGFAWGFTSVAAGYVNRPTPIFSPRIIEPTPEE